MRKRWDVAYETGIPHLVDFIESMRSRRDPVAPVEVGHRTCTTCTLGNIAYELDEACGMESRLRSHLSMIRSRKVLSQGIPARLFT
jgi:hypothetical protein